MLVTFEPLDAEALSVLRIPADLPPGMVFEPISMEAALGDGDAFRLTASLFLTEDVATDRAAGWIWARLEHAAPLVVAAAGTRARIGEAAALAWLLDRARGAA